MLLELVEDTWSDDVQRPELRPELYCSATSLAWVLGSLRSTVLYSSSLYRIKSRMVECELSWSHPQQPVALRVSSLLFVRLSGPSLGAEICI